MNGRRNIFTDDIVQTATDDGWTDTDGQTDDENGQTGKQIEDD